MAILTVPKRSDNEIPEREAELAHTELCRKSRRNNIVRSVTWGGHPKLELEA